MDKARHFELEAIGALPDGSEAQLDVPGWLADALGCPPAQIRYSERRRRARIPLHRGGVQRLGPLLLHANSAATCELLVRVPAEARRHDCDFAVRQLYQGTEVGRVTWRFAALTAEALPAAQQSRQPRRK